MPKKYIIFTLLFSVFILQASFGAAVSCLVIETGASGGSKSQYSAMWENSMMDVLFDNGHIVSNAPRMRLDRKPAASFPPEAEKDYQEARINGMEYFVIAIIEQGSGGVAQTVSLRLFSTDSQKMINEQVYAYSAPKSAREENENIKKAVSLIAAQIK